MDLLKFVFVAVGLGLLYFALRPRAPLRIVISPGKVRVIGAYWQARAGAIVDFFQNDLPEVASGRVDGSWDRRRLRLRFHGPITPRQQQRIRNFLHSLP